jgi:hypothetical protein
MLRKRELAGKALLFPSSLRLLSAPHFALAVLNGAEGAKGIEIDEPVSADADCAHEPAAG